MSTRLALSVLVALCGTTVHAEVLSDFGDADGTPSLQGWEKDGQFVGELVVTSVGGRAMTLHAIDDCWGCGSLYAGAPPAYLGDLKGYTGIAWEEYLVHNSTTHESNTIAFLQGADGTVFRTRNPPRGDPYEWRTRYHPFVPSEWERTSGSSSFNQVLSSVTNLRIRLETGWNELTRDEGYVDDVRLEGPGCIAPCFTVVPSSRSVLPGDDVTFWAWANGADPISYQWQFEGTDLPGETGTTFTVISVDPGHEGQYTVVASNAHGQVSASAQLVLYCPVILAQPTDRAALIGDDATFVVVAESAIEPVYYRWQFQGTDLPGETSPSLVVANAQPGDAGLYRAIVSNACGSVTSDVATLTVGCPLIQEHPADQVVYACGDAAFSVVAEGPSPLTYQWYFNGTNLPGATNSELVIENVGFSDSGGYSVTVDSACGTATSDIAVLTWDGCLEPEIIANPRSIVAFPGSNVEFRVSPTHTCDIQWLHDGSPVTGGTGEVLSLSNVQTNDSGGYQAVVSNICGTATSSVAQLYVYAYGELLCYTNTLLAGNMHLIANQVERGSNTLNEIMPTVPEGSRLLKYNNQSQAFEVAEYWNGFWADLQPASPSNHISLHPGEGAYLFPTWSTTITFCGILREPVLPHPDWPAPGMYSRQEPLPGSWDNIMGVVPNVGDRVFIWDTALMDYEMYDYIPGTKGGPPIWSPAEPQTDIGESLFYDASVCLVPYIAEGPTSQSAGCGDSVMFTVDAEYPFGSGPPIYYQWYLNDSPLLGATDSNLVISGVGSDDVGYYHVVVSNECGTAPSLRAPLDVIDDVAPLITTCASNRILATGPACLAFLPDLTVEVVASDDCGPVTVTQQPDAGTGLTVGETVVTLTVTDYGENVTNCTATVTVVDETPPIITCPTNIQTLCTGTNGAQVSFSPAADDNCDPSPMLVAVPPSGSWFGEGTHLVECTAWDVYGNTNSCSFQVVVVDPVVPILRIRMEGGELHASWAHCCTTYVMEQSTNLVVPFPWSPFAAPVYSTSNEFYMVLPDEQDAAFYRLLKP